jgi:uncharacterized RDD family membrane protein YckC
MMADHQAKAADPSLQGHYAGFVSRFMAFIVDVLLIGAIFALTGHVVEYVVTAARGEPFQLSDTPIVADVALAGWAFFYSAYTLARAGRTPGMALVGLRVVRRDGSVLDGGRAVLRVLVFPLSFLVFFLGFVMILIGRERRALHDVIAGTAVVYSWDAYAARLRFLARRTTP